MAPSSMHGFYFIDTAMCPPQFNTIGEGRISPMRHQLAMTDSVTEHPARLTSMTNSLVLRVAARLCHLIWTSLATLKGNFTPLAGVLLGQSCKVK